MKIKFLSTTLVFAVAIGLSSVQAQASHHHKAGLTDALFAKKAAAGGLTEVQLGQIAQQNGSSQEVKDFGAKMVTDHGKVNDNLKSIATKDNLTIPDKPNAEQQALIDKLTKETGKQFDTAYIHAMIKAHEGDKALFTQESENAKNPDLKQFAQDTLPMIKEHLSMIEGIAGGHPESASSSTTNMPMAPGSNANPVPNTPTTSGASSTDTTTTPTTPDTGSSGSNANPVPATSPMP